MQLETWAEVVRYVSAAHSQSRQVADDVLQVTVTLPEGTSAIELGWHVLAGTAWISVHGRIASARNVVPRWSLQANWTTAIGNLALHHGDVIARQLLPLATTSGAIDDTILAIAYQCLLGKAPLGE